MIVACPFCQTRFLLPASLLAAGPRQMRCAKCKHSWQTDALTDSKEGDTASAIPPVAETASTAFPPAAPAIDHSIMPPSVKRILKRGLWAIGVLFLAWLALDRQNIAQQLGFMEPFYDIIGLHIYHTGEGLTIRSVRSELVYEDGIMKLSVEGKIVNTTKKTLQIPPLRASAIASDGHVMQDWQIDAPAAKVTPGEEVSFHSSINAPKGSVADINLNFIEIKPDAQ